MKVIVRWNQSHVMSVGTGLNDGSVVQFMPGPNEVNAKTWENVKKNPAIKTRMETEIVDPKRGKVPMLEVVSKKVDEKKGEESETVEGISELGVKEAKALVEETFNTALLREWKESETRKGALTAIEKQLEAIEKERESESDSQE